VAGEDLRFGWGVELDVASAQNVDDREGQGFLATFLATFLAAILPPGPLATAVHEALALFLGGLVVVPAAVVLFVVLVVIVVLEIQVGLHDHLLLQMGQQHLSVYQQFVALEAPQRSQGVGHERKICVVASMQHRFQ
jgi:hypothetical protein